MQKNFNNTRNGTIHYTTVILHVDIETGEQLHREPSKTDYQYIKLTKHGKWNYTKTRCELEITKQWRKRLKLGNW